MQTLFKRCLLVAVTCAMAPVAVDASVIYQMNVVDNHGDTVKVVDNGNGTETVTYSGSGTATGTGTFAVLSGELFYNGRFGGLTIDSNTAFNSISPTSADLDLNIDSATSTLPQTLTIVAYHLNESYSYPGASPPVTLRDSYSGSGPGIVKSYAGYGPTNGAPSGPAGSPPVYTMPYETSVSVTGLGSASSSTLVPFANPYSLMSESVVKFTGKGGVVAGDGFASVDAAPEPGTLAILMSALPLVGYGALRRRRKGAA